MRAAVQAGVDAANAKLARVEQIKRFAIVEGDWLPGGDELTPTMKLKRRPIGEKYAAEIEAMYALGGLTRPASYTEAQMASQRQSTSAASRSAAARRSSCRR